MPVVRINDVIAAMLVSGEMHLNNAVVRNLPDIMRRIEIVIKSRHVNVIYVQQQAASGFLGHIPEKIPFGDG